MVAELVTISSLPPACSSERVKRVFRSSEFREFHSNQFDNTSPCHFEEESSAVPPFKVTRKQVNNKATPQHNTLQLWTASLSFDSLVLEFFSFVVVVVVVHLVSTFTRPKLTLN